MKGTKMRDEFDDIYGNKYIGAADLNGSRRRVKISGVNIEDLGEKDGSTKRKYVLYFEDEEKALPLNKTNATKLALAFGRDRAKWVGRRLELYREPRTILAFGSGCSARAEVSPRSGTVLTPGRRPRGPLHDATRSPPVSALKRVQLPPARAEPAGGCCSRGSSCRS